MARVARFGVFEVDPDAGVLRKRGIKIKLQAQPLRVLLLLLEAPTHEISREQLREKFWPRDIFVDFEHGMSSAVAKLRQALGDSAENPRFVETVERRGYRLMVPVEFLLWPGTGRDGSPAESGPRPVPATHSRWAHAQSWLTAGLAGLLATAATGWLLWQRMPVRSALKPEERPTKSILVLPLENFSGDPQEQYFVDGLTDELTTRLAKMGSIEVISRTSAMQLKNASKPLRQLARELKVDEIVEGSVMRSGSRIKITAQLIDASTDRHVWAETYERQVSDVLAVQAEISQDIAGQIRNCVGPREKRAVIDVPRIAPDAHEAFLMGRYYLNQGTEGEIWKGIEQFQRAIQKSPSYAPAWVGLADSYVAFSDFYLAPDQTMPKAKAAAMRALELDRELAEAHTSLGAVRFLSDWDWEAAETEFKRALDLNPNSTDAHVWYANFLGQMGRTEAAFQEIQRAERLDPRSPNVYLNAGFLYYMSRQNDNALGELKKAADLEPYLQFTHGSIWLAYFTNPGGAPLLAAMGRGLSAKSDSPLILAALAGLYATQGRRREASAIVASLREISKSNYVCPYEMAATHVALGRKQEALRSLEEAYRHRSICLPSLKTDPRFEQLHSDLQFQNLLARLKFP